jgi:hypothetical protein
VIDVDPAMNSDGFSFQPVQPSLVTDRAQVRNKAGKYLVRVCFVQIDEGDAFRSCMNAGDNSLNIDLLAGVFRSVRGLNCVDREN